VRAFIHFSQVLCGEMGINLGGGDIGMSQQFLKLPEIHLATVQQMGSYAVTQHVRRDVGLDSGSLSITLKDKPESLPGKSLSSTIEE
jgi:hypothetical protein